MIETNNVVERLETAVRSLDWKAPVPDDLQSEIRMVFNEALAGGPNMNGDGGPTLTPNHALDCVWATQRIQSLSDRIDVLEGAGNALIAKLDECEPHITNAFAMEHFRGRPYSGPQYKDELAALRASLTQGGKNV